MSSIEETAYPRLLADVPAQELDQLYTPTASERAFVSGAKALRRPMAKACAMLQLKIMQRLGYSVPLASVPLAITAHVCRKLRVSRPTLEALSRYDNSADASRHRQLVLKVLGLKDPDSDAMRWIAQRAEAAAGTKQELADIINVVLEELVRQHYVLPGFTVMLRMARAAREKVNQAIYERTTAALDGAVRQRLDALLDNHGGKTDWDRLKREPKQPTKREVASFLLHIRWLAVHAEGLPEFEGVAATKLAQLTLEARALDAAQMKVLPPNKRYTLATLLVRSRLRQATDDVAEIFVKSMRKLDNDGQKSLKEYHLEHTRQVERLVGQLRDVLTAFQQEVSDAQRGAAVGQALHDEPQQLIAECDEHMAYADNNYYPFMLRPYGAKRALLFECLSVLQPLPTYVDGPFSSALGWVLEHRNSHKEHLRPLRKLDGVELELRWLPDKWRKLIVTQDAAGDTQVHRKYLEMAVFMRIFEELQSGDLYVPRSEQYDDYRAHFMEEQAFRAELPLYTELVGLPTDGATFAETLRRALAETADATDRNFPENDSVAWGPNGLVIRKVEKKVPPLQLVALDQALNDALGLHSIVDVLTETEKWLDLHKLFRPLSGYESKLEDPQARFIATLFCYGCNMGASQTARSLKGLSRKQVAWLNLHHVTEERLDQAVVKVINAYNRFALPGYWGSGKRAAADGTKWSMYEKNLLSEYHIRYGGYGGIGYYHVSDTYIALFSHFIPCGVYEAIYILDGLIRNQSDIKPDTVHGDTQAQSTPVFALAHLLGIELMPRIRNIKDLVFFKPGRETRYQAIQPLFSGGAIDWDLIARHYEDMLRVAVSIKAGMITPSTLLRRLGSASRKNKLYFAFRELGRAIRTMFLLRYISEPELRRTIHAETNKTEEFHQFAGWAFFGGEGIMAENVRHEQRKVVKYNHLVANMIILNNVHRMSKVLKEMQDRGAFDITEEVLGGLSPYRTIHINRFGDYLMDLERAVEPMNTRIKFGLKKKVARAE
ncbi:MAG: Tn3 family transposase [Proteobacteria bacterium]|nr:Tn3 family transposase [Pseudomonadota bacterium]